VQELRDSVAVGDAEAALALTEDYLSTGIDATTIMSDGLIPAMDDVGQQFSTGEIYVPEMLVAAMAMKKCLERLKPLLVASKEAGRETIVIGSVKGDLHDIGKNIVAIMLEGAGFEVVDLGVDVSPNAFIEAIDQYRPEIIAMSCLLTTTMPMMPATIHAFEHAGVRDRIRVLVGGAPVTNEWATSIGADAYAPNAAAAVETAKQLIGRSTAGRPSPETPAGA
jgi:5-methyltetrahydrofolate--homocysteine methyltransferase